MHRMQIMLEDDQYERLKMESRRRGQSIGALVREAIATRYDHLSVEEFDAVLEATRGTWSDRDFDGYEWVEGGRGGLDRSIGEFATWA